MLVTKCGFFCLGIYEKFVDAFSKAVQKFQVGHGFSEGVTQVVHAVFVKFYGLLYWVPYDILGLADIAMNYMCLTYCFHFVQGPLINEAAVQKVCFLYQIVVIFLFVILSSFFFF